VSFGVTGRAASRVLFKGAALASTRSNTTLDFASRRYLDVPYDELVRRVVERTAQGGIPIAAEHMESYRGRFEAPMDEELSLFDPPLELHGI